MLAVNLFVIDRCSEKKYSPRLTYALMLLGAMLLMPITYAISAANPHFGNGNGLFVISGFLFIFPIKALYKNSVAKIVSLACTSWVYTFIIFAITVHVAYMLPDIPLIYTTITVQTALYTFTITKFYRLIKEKFLSILSQLTPTENISLMWVSIFWFWTAFIINLSFIYPQIYPLRTIAILSFAFCAYNFYKHIYRMLDSNRVIERLKDVAYKDNLTQLRSRAVLSNDVNELISRGISFRVIFMDLNNFKSINDEYGHLAGDEYLSFFAREIKLRVGSNGGVYRIAGDEFVCIYTGDDVLRFTDAMASFPQQLPGKDIPFLGASYGIASFPDDGASLTDLLHVADGRMYAMKPSRAGSR